MPISVIYMVDVMGQEAEDLNVNETARRRGQEQEESCKLSRNGLTW